MPSTEQLRPVLEQAAVHDWPNPPSIHPSAAAVVAAAVVAAAVVAAAVVVAAEVAADTGHEARLVPQQQKR